MKKKTLYILLLIFVWSSFIFDELILDLVVVSGVTLMIFDMLGVLEREGR